MTFYVGLHKVHYLDVLPAHVTVMTSRQHVTSRHYKAWPSVHPDRPLVLDSGGFWEVSRHGHHRTPARRYADEVRFVRDHHPGLRWAAVQDWMCEDVALRRTGLTVLEHQDLTCQSLDALLRIAPDLPWMPVLQGRTEDDYLTHLQMHLARGHDLRDGRDVGLGSVCRRQGTLEIASIIRRLHDAGVTGLHGFGMKTSGLRRVGHLLRSSDSTAWLEDSIHRGHQRDCPRPIQPSTQRTYPPGHCPGCIAAWWERVSLQIQTG